MKHIPRKRFGQHFLVDAAVIEAIVDAIDPRAGEPLIEIGPGLGALTEALLARGARLTVIELDRDLAARWRRDGRVQVIEADVLTVDFAALADATGAPLRVAGNLPYNISSPILFHLLPLAGRVRDQHFMLQKEVVDRMVAAPGTADYGRLSVMLQYRFAMALAFRVPPGAFTPPPKVDSAIVRMQPLGEGRLAARDEARFGQVVAAAFSQRRKTLRNALRALVDEAAFDRAGVDPRRRGETLSVAEFVALADASGG